MMASHPAQPGAKRWQRRGRYCGSDALFGSTLLGVVRLVRACSGTVKAALAELLR